MKSFRHVGPGGLLMVAAILAAVGPAEGQVYVESRFVYQTTIVYPPPNETPFKELNRLFEEGNWQGLQEAVRKALATLIEQDESQAKAANRRDSLGRLDDLGNHLGDFRHDFYNVVWETTGKDGKPALARVLYHRNLKPEHASQLPGLTGSSRPLRDVFLSPTKEARLAASCVSTEVQNPALAQLPDFVGRIPLLSFLAKAAGPAAAAAVLPTVTVTVSEAALPNESAKLACRHVVFVPFSATEFVKQADALVALPAPGVSAEKSVLIREAWGSRCAALVARSVTEKLESAVKDEQCKEAESGASLAVLRAKGALCAKRLNRAVSEGYAEAYASPVCPAQTGEAEAAMKVEAKFRDLVGSAQRTVSADSELTNVPDVRYSFGLMTGLVVGRSSLSPSHPRVKLDSGKIVEDPVQRSLTTAIVNIHPWGYRASSNRMSLGERARLFAGAVLTPDFGLTAGGGIAIVRGLAFNVGGAVLFSDTLREGDSLGGAVSNKQNPFKTRSHRVGLVGLSYVFK